MKIEIDLTKLKGAKLEGTRLTIDNIFENGMRLWKSKDGNTHVSLAGYVIQRKSIGKNGETHFVIRRRTDEERALAANGQPVDTIIGNIYNDGESRSPQQ